MKASVPKISVVIGLNFCTCLGLLLGNSLAALPLFVVGAYLSYLLISLRGSVSHPAVLLTTAYFFCFAVSLFAKPSFLAVYGLTSDNGSLIQAGYALCIVALLMPLQRLRPVDPGHFRPNRYVNAAVTLGWIPASFAVLYLGPFAVHSFQSGADVVRLGLASEGAGLPSTFATTAAVAVSQFFPVYIMLWFYATVTARPVRYRLLTFIGVIAGLCWGAVFAARDVLIWVPILLWFGYWYWSPLLSQRQARRFKLTFGACGGLLAIVFVIYTVERFWASSLGMIDSLMAYFGYQPFVFAETVASQEVFYGADLRFPLLATIFGGYTPVERSLPYQWMFGTLVTDFYSVAGWLSLVLIAGALAISGWLAFSARAVARRGVLGNLLFYLVYFLIMAQGLFYFRYGTLAGNYFLIITVIVAFYLGRQGVGSRRQHEQ